MGKHDHQFTSLWDHWGPYGEQDEHVHACFFCDGVVLVGAGRNCKAGYRDHQIKRWTGKRWVNLGGPKSVGVGPITKALGG